ncbi:MAG: hypothetical protein RR494_13195 [Vagococcus sp.]|uniref:hypothetical protein n=1 Tax=Vagococcus sp. TaxID=1933889 RepID=UPI002FC7FCFD
MTESEKLIELNNELREQLTPENNEYYENILIYLRTKSLFQDELTIEKILIELLQDILEAQKNNESAKDYFGENPQPMLDTLLKQVPKISFLKKLKLMLIVFSISSVFALFSMLTKPEPTLNFLTLLFNGVISFIFVELIFLMINRYTFKPNKSKKKEYLVVFLVSFIFIGLTFLSNIFGDFWLSIPVPSFTSLVIVWSALLIASIWILVKKKKEYYYAIPSLTMLALIPTLLKLPMTKHLFISSTNKIIMVVIALIVIYGSMFISSKKLKSE